ncbi:MAG: hypothetical protein ACTHJ7_05735 [Candidatus Nitrosocosmicus sp.]
MITAYIVNKTNTVFNEIRFCMYIGTVISTNSSIQSSPNNNNATTTKGFGDDDGNSIAIT